MKKSILVLTAVISQSASALEDSCTAQLDPYIEGLRIGIMLAGEPHLVNDNIKQPERLEALRKTLPDCDIANTIPGLASRAPALGSSGMDPQPEHKEQRHE